MSGIPHAEFGERGVQRLARVEEPARDGALGHLQDLSDLGIAEALQVLEHEHLPVLLSDALESAPQHLPRGVPLTAALRTLLGVRRSAVEPLVDRLHPEFRLPGPEHVPALIPEDLEEPWTERAGEVEPRQRVVRLHERLL